MILERATMVKKKKKRKAVDMDEEKPLLEIDDSGFFDEEFSDADQLQINHIDDMKIKIKDSDDLKVAE
ncbi:MAG: hypothetical protein ACTSQB_06330, partial [Candidatus Heimdallarchaeota archaeon]